MKSKEPLGSTPLDEEDRAGLLQEYITSREELNEAEFRNINQAAQARFAANLYLKWHGTSIVNWPENEFLVSSSFRKEYVSALQKADRGDFSALIKIHRNLAG